MSPCEFVSFFVSTVLERSQSRLGIAQPHYISTFIISMASSFYTRTLVTIPVINTSRPEDTSYLMIETIIVTYLPFELQLNSILLVYALEAGDKHDSLSTCLHVKRSKSVSDFVLAVHIASANPFYMFFVFFCRCLYTKV